MPPPQQARPIVSLQKSHVDGVGVGGVGGAGGVGVVVGGGVCVKPKQLASASSPKFPFNGTGDVGDGARLNSNWPHLPDALQDSFLVLIMVSMPA